MLDVMQTVNPNRSFVMGRNGLWKMKALHIWQTGDGRTVFECISRRDAVLNAGFGIDNISFERLICRLISRRDQTLFSDSLNSNR